MNFNKESKFRIFFWGGGRGGGGGREPGEGLASFNLSYDVVVIQWIMSCHKICMIPWWQLSHNQGQGHQVQAVLVWK